MALAAALLQPDEDDDGYGQARRGVEVQATGRRASALPSPRAAQQAADKHAGEDEDEQDHKPMSPQRVEVGSSTRRESVRGRRPSASPSPKAAQPAAETGADEDVMSPSRAEAGNGTRRASVRLRLPQQAAASGADEGRASSGVHQRAHQGPAAAG